MQDIPIRQHLSILRINNCSLYAFLYFVTSTSSTIIIKIIIAIRPISRAIIVFQQLYQLNLFCIRQIQFLLINRRSTHSIFTFEITKWNDPQLVIGFSFDKSHHKIGIFKAEHPVIEHPVLLFCRIFITNSRMTKQRVNFRTRCTSQQTDTNAVQRYSPYRKKTNYE